jgi:hypothetical protein
MKLRMEDNIELGRDIFSVILPISLVITFLCSCLSTLSNIVLADLWSDHYTIELSICCHLTSNVSDHYTIELSIYCHLSRQTEI